MPRHAKIDDRFGCAPIRRGEDFNIRVIIGTVHFFHAGTYKIPSS